MSKELLFQQIIDNTINVLTLDSSHDINNNDVILLQGLLEDNTSVTSIDVSHCCTFFYLPGARLLSKIIELNPRIIDINAAGNRLGYLGTSVLD